MKSNNRPRKVTLLVVIVAVSIVSTASVLSYRSAAKAKHIPAIPGPSVNDTLFSRPLALQVDSIVVLKSQRNMYVYHHNRLQKVYKISLGKVPVGPKHFKGDRKTPEGLYYIDDKNPNSMAHKNLGISYPNNNDRKYAQSQGQQTGGDVKIHGILNGEEYNKDAYVGVDWTWGCIAISNDDIDEIYAHVTPGIPINILP